MSHKEHKNHNKHNDIPEVNTQNNSTNILFSIIIVLLIIIAFGAFYMGKSMNNGGMMNSGELINNGNNVSSNLEVKVIDDKRCNNCQTENLITNLKKVPALKNSKFNVLDFSDKGVAEYLKNNNIRTLPAVIFQTNFIAPGINEGLKPINDTEFALDLGPNAKFNPFEKRSNRGFLLIDKEELKQIKKDSYIKGNIDAKITWLEYSDLECPFCARLHNSTTSKDLQDKYGDNLNIIFNHFPLSFHDEAQKGGETLECIAELNGSDSMYNIIKKSYAKYKNNDFDLKGLYDIASEEGVNKEDLIECVNSNKYAEKVQKQMNIGSTIFGITGTPGNVLINNETGEYEILSGAYPTPAFEAIIDRLLSK